MESDLFFPITVTAGTKCLTGLEVQDQSVSRIDSFLKENPVHNSFLASDGCLQSFVLLGL